MENRLKSIVAILLLSVLVTVYAQDKVTTNFNHSAKFIYEVGVGCGFLIGNQNISPWGMHYRGNYDKGTNVYVQADYLFKDRTTLGLKVEMFATAGNYQLETNERVAENINLFYFAPQLGSSLFVSSRTSFSYNLGVGYALYRSYGLLNQTDYNINSHLLGVNIDSSLDYLLTKKLAIGCNASVFGGFLSDKQHREIGDDKNKVSMDKWDRINPLKINLNVFFRVYL